MADNYVVNYDINVRSQDAVTALTNFQTAINNLTALGTKLNEFQKKLNGITTKIPKMDISTRGINMKLDRVIAKLERIHTLAKTVPAINSKGQVIQQAPPTPQSQPKQKTAPRGSSKISYINRGLPNNLTYKLLGPTPLDTGNFGLDFLKGMGIAYGIAGAGTLIRNVISEATEYNNLMQTTKNILKTHDKDSNFGGRFSQMEQIVRNVGVETKFTAPQVADAAKFLAMAGFDINAINQSIRPIADIALIGDTELGETADVVTNIMTGYGISPDKVRKATDVMTMTFTKSNTTLLEIAEAYKYSASLLSAAGIEFEESTAAIGILGDAGIKGSQAGTTMRTIMANIVNPTKKQLAQWEKIGVSRMDENGKVRDLVDIFKDLSEAGLYVDDFYKLFHKTAAQGAVSLANHVDKWNEVIADNFLSDGLAKQLADEKKNTIQGLWMQLSSAFTEAGLQAFEVMTPSIKRFLGEGTEWIKSDSFKESMKGFSRELMGFAEMLVNTTKKFLEWGAELKGIIKLWVNFQIKLMPVMAGLRVFSAAMNGGASIIKFAGKIAFLTGKLQKLTKSILAIKTVSGLGSALRSTVLSSVIPYLTGNWYNALYGKNVSPKVWERFLSRHPDPKALHRNTLSNYGKGIGGAAGGFLAGHQIGEAFGMGHTGKTILGAAGGIGTYLALLAGGPVGWGTAITVGLGGLVAWLINVKKKTNAAREAWEEYTNSFKMVDGVMTGENLTKTEKYLEIVYNKQLSITDVIAKRVELMKEELGLQDAQNVDSTYIDGRAGHKFLTDIPGITDTGKGVDVVKTVNATLEGLGAIASYATDRSGKLTHFYWDGVKVKGKRADSDVMQALSALFIEGLTGSQGKAAEEEMQTKLSKALLTGNQSEFDALKKYWHNIYETQADANLDSKSLPSDFQYTTKQIEEMLQNGDSAVGNMFTYQQGLYMRMADRYAAGGSVWKAVDEYFNAFNNKTLTEENVLKFMSLADLTAGAGLKGYYSHETGFTNNKSFDEWAKTLGYWNNTFQPNEEKGYSALTVAQTTQAYLDRILKIADSFPEYTQSQISDLTAFATQLKGFADAFITSSTAPSKNNKIKEAKDGETVEVNGVKYTYSAKEGMWIPDNTALSKVDPKTMNAMRGDDDNNSNSHSTPNPSDYSTDYKSTSAAPKQIIVKIENLMNVESIDMSNPDNVAVVGDIKAQLAQALVDVVSDFTNNLGN